MSQRLPCKCFSLHERFFSSFELMLFHLKLFFLFNLTLYNNYASRVLNQNNNMFFSVIVDQFFLCTKLELLVRLSV